MVNTKMKRPFSKLGTLLALPYLLLAIAAFAYTLRMTQYHPSKSAFAGVYLSALALPWSLGAALTLILFAMLGVDFSSVARLITYVGIIFNVVLIYRLGEKVENTKPSGE